MKTKRVPRSQWNEDEKLFDRLVTMMDSRIQMNRIEGRIQWTKFCERFTKEQMDSMWERIK